MNKDIEFLYNIVDKRPKKNLNRFANKEFINKELHLKYDHFLPVTNQNGNYVFNQNGKYFEFPTTYRVYVDKDNTIYVGKNIDDKGALIPYIMIEKYKNYTDPSVLLNDVTTELNKAYGDVKILLNQLSGYVGDKLTYGSMFSYTSSGHLVIDNRYTFLVGNSMYLVTTKEENENSTEINNVCALIIKTLKEVN